jgi:outer membrane receptor protein involved in Fe transport
MGKLYLIFLVLVSIYAKEEMDFLKTLNEVNEIAYKNRINIDKVPANMDIIDRDFIIKSGAKTLLDLFKYISGVEITYTPEGKPQLVVRGNRSEFVDKIKLMINGIEVNNELFNNEYYFYNLPAALIKRVEFVKTPNAVLYGDNAFLGVINVVTLNDIDDNVVNFYMSDKNQETFSIFKKVNDNLLVDFYYSYSNPTVYSPNIYLADLNFSAKLFRNSTRASTLEKSLGIGIRYKKDKSTIRYRSEYYKKGNFFGFENVTPLKQDKFLKNFYQFLNYNFSDYLKFNLKESFNIGIKHYILNWRFRTFPYDYNESNPHNDPSKDIIGGASYNEIKIIIKNLLKYNTDRHNTKFLLQFQYIKPYDYYYVKYIPAFENETKLKGDKNFLKEGIKRYGYTGAIEDLFEIKEKIYLTYGYRLDYFNDVKFLQSYKISGVYNKSEKTTFKLLFNKAFRIPSFIELYARNNPGFNGDENLKSECIKMLEFIWLQKIFKKDKFKFVVYKGLNKNFIGRDFDPQGKMVYKNLGNIDIRGFEISYKKEFTKAKMFVSYAFNDNKYNYLQIVSGLDIARYHGINKHQIKSYLQYDIRKNVALFSSFFYGSKIHLPAFVGDVKSYFSLNANIKYNIKNNFKLLIGADNITNHKNYFMVFPSDLIAGEYFFEYDKAKLPYFDRKFYINLIKEW